MQDKSPTNPRSRPTQAGTERGEGDRTDASGKGGVPTVTRMPEGYEVHEQRLGRAFGQWVLQVRCQCGRGWFEIEAIDATHCPRCGMLVYLDVQDRST